MSLSEKQLKLEATLKNAHTKRNEWTKKIVKTRSALDKFTKKHGNVVLKEQKAEDWKKRKKEIAVLHADPVWKAKHEAAMVVIRKKYNL